MESRTWALLMTAWAVAVAAYGVWYGAFAKEYKARHPWTGRTKYTYKPSSYLRVMVLIVSVSMLIGGIAQMVRLWKSH